MTYLNDNLGSRTDLIKRVIDKCMLFQAYSYLFLGEAGCGKNYVTRSICKKISEHENISVLELLDDQLVQKNRKYKTHKLNIEFNAAFYIGLAGSIVEKNDSKLNYIISTLKEVKNRNIVIVQSNIEKTAESVMQLIKFISQNKAYIENQTDKILTIICTSNIKDSSAFSDWQFCETINFKKYSEEAVKQYIEKDLNYSLEKVVGADQKLSRLIGICNSNLNLINIIYREVFENDISFSESLTEIVNIRINEIKKQYADNQCVSENDLEDIILSCSFSIDYFNRFLIGFTSQKDDSIILSSLHIFDETNIIYKKDIENYLFVSDEIKLILSQKMKGKNQEQYIRFYNYITIYKNDSYYERAFYLLKYFNNVDKNVLSLLLLAISKAFVFDDEWKLEKIIDIFDEYPVLDEYKIAINQFISACEAMKIEKYRNAIQQLDNIDLNFFNKVARAEINRIKFRCYYYVKDTQSNICYKTLFNLANLAQNPLCFNFNENGEYCTEEEYTLKLQILYDIAPCAIDDYNEYELFQELYDAINKLMRQVNNKGITTKYMEYILNVFNRKAFLYANPMTVDTYYDEAKSFFYSNKIYDEYCITLICYAGSLLASSEYSKAIKLCKEAETIIKEKRLIIPTPQKLINNLSIAEFLQFENTSQCIDDIKKFSYKTALKLFRLCEKLNSSATKHVMLTNVASLALYSENIQLYEMAKREIELSIECDNVSNLHDEHINDFYRYHFAWFELFKNMQNDNWNYCQNLIDELDNFIPALFKKSESLWKKKNYAARELIRNRSKIDGYYFCRHLVDLKLHKGEYNSFCYRGLPLSDLQYTSYS